MPTENPVWLEGKTQLKLLTVAVFVLLALAAVSPPVEASAGVVEGVDENHALNSAQAIALYEETGNVSTNLTSAGVNAEVTVTDDPSDVEGVDGGLLGFTDTYLIVEHREEVTQAVRVYLPPEYFRPYEKSDVDTEVGDARVDFSMVSLGNTTYTSAVFHFQGRDRVVVEPSTLRGYSFTRTLRIDHLLDDAAGITLFTTDSQWQYIGSTALAGNKSMYEIPEPPDKVTIQYAADDDGDSEEPVWLLAPRRDADYPVYYYTPEDANVTRVVSMEDSSPQVRWKNDTDSVDSAEGVWNDISKIPERIEDDFNITLPSISDITPWRYKP